MCALFIASNSATAFDYTGRIDTRYKLQIGDNATDNDIYQYHFFNLLPSDIGIKNQPAGIIQQADFLWCDPIKVISLIIH